MKKEMKPIKELEVDLGWIIRDQQIFEAMLMDGRRRQVIIDKFINNLSLEQIALKMDLSTERVRQLYRTGLDTLYRNVAEHLRSVQKIRDYAKENSELRAKLCQYECRFFQLAEKNIPNPKPISVVDIKGLSARTKNVLKAHDINDLETLVSVDSNTVLSYRNMGLVGINQIRSALRSMGIKW